MPVPYPNLSEGIATFPNLIQKANEASAGYGGDIAIMGYMILVIVTIVTFISLKDFEPKQALPATMFVSFITSVFLSVGLGLIPDSMPVIPLIAMVLSWAMLFHEKKGE